MKLMGYENPVTGKHEFVSRHYEEISEKLPPIKDTEEFAEIMEKSKRDGRISFLDFIRYQQLARKDK